MPWQNARSAPKEQNPPELLKLMGYWVARAANAGKIKARQKVIKSLGHRKSKKLRPESKTEVKLSALKGGASR
jgi:hypothetical protein